MLNRLCGVLFTGFVLALNHPDPAFSRDENTILGRVILPGNYLGLPNEDCPRSKKYPDLQDGGTVLATNEDGEIIGRGLLLPASNVPISPELSQNRSLQPMACHALFVIKVPSAQTYSFQIVSPDLLITLPSKFLIEKGWRLVIFAK
jgi:hypothetical protein